MTSGSQSPPSPAVVDAIVVEINNDESLPPLLNDEYATLLSSEAATLRSVDLGISELLNVIEIWLSNLTEAEIGASPAYINCLIHVIAGLCTQNAWLFSSSLDALKSSMRRVMANILSRLLKHHVDTVCDVVNVNHGTVERGRDSMHSGFIVTVFI